jgi:predicted Zn-ribbon and HTH transcriptional regulator
MATVAQVRIKNVRCKLCGSRSMYRYPDEKPTKCSRCGNDYKSAKFISVHDEKATPGTHYMVRWGCRSCKHHGVNWVKRGTNLTHCPNCKEERRSVGMWVSKIDPAGSCDTIWQPVQGVTRLPIKVRLPKKRHRCGNCGYSVSYLVRYPPACPRCGNQEW